MARVKLAFPNDNLLFSTEIPVRITDINYANHVGNDAFLSLLQEARVQWLRRHGWTETDCAGSGLIMTDVQISYRAESFYGDLLQICIFATVNNPYGFDLLYRVSTLREAKPIDILHASTGMLCFDYRERRKQVMPPALLAVLGGLRAER